MPSNVQLDVGTGGAIAAAAQIAHDGDTAQLQLVGLMGIAGTEDAYTAAKINGDATNGLDVDVTRLLPGSTATALGKLEDAAHASGDLGVMALAVRQDTAAALAGTDADYQPLISDASGRLHVNVGTSALPTGAATAANQGTANTALAAIQTAVETLDNAIAGAEMQVDVVGALPAGNNNIGDVDVASLPAGSMAAVAARTSDYDTGAGTDTVPMMGIALPAAGGAVQGGTATNPVRTDPTGTTTQPVSGTVTANLAAGTNNIGDVDVLTLPALPAGANNIGDVDVLSVVPGTGATSLGKTEDAAHASGDVGVMLLTVRQDVAAALGGTDGDYQPPITDVNGRLHVIEPSAANAAASLAVLDDWDETDRCRVNPIVGQAGVAAGAGAVGATVQRTTLASDDPAVTALQLLDNAAIADDAAFTPGTTGVQMVGFTADETATDSVDEGDGGAARMTLDRKIIVTPYAHAAAGGATPYQNLNVNAAISVVKASVGKLYGIHAMNLTNPGAVVYLKFWNEAAADIGSDIPVWTLPIPHGSGSLGAGFVFPIPDIGAQFSAGICVACTGASAPLDETSLSSSAIIVNLLYQ